MERRIVKKMISRDEKGLVLVVTLLLLSVLVIMGTTAIMAVSTDIKIAGNYRQNQVALYRAEAGVEQVIRYLRTNTVNYPTVNATESIINGGTCPTSQCVPITMPFPSGFGYPSTVTVNIYGYDVTNHKYVFRMTGTGPSSASKTIEAYVARDTNLESVDGAVAMYGGGPEVALKSGANPQENYAINGQDYPVPTDPNCSGSACETSPDTTKPALPGLYTVMTPTVTGTLSYLNGNPDQTIGPSNETAWNDFVDNVIANNLYQTTMGTRAAPAITLVPNGATLSGTYNGAGIIIVDNGGELTLSGNGCYEGIIILRGTGTVRGTGTNNLYGSIITIGHESKLISATGSVNMYYSSAAIANLSQISSLSTVQKTAWRDLM